MSLNRISVSGFKNINKTTIELSKITSLLSISSYGKSNLLAAFNFGFDFINQQPKIKSRMMAYKRAIPLVLSNLYEDFAFEFNLEASLDGKIHDIIYGFSFQWSVNKRKGQILSEYLKIKESGESQKYTLYIDRKQDSALYKSSVSGRCDKDIQIANNELILNKIVAFDNLFYLDVIKYLNNISIYIDKHLDTTNSFNSTPFIIKGIDELSLDSQNEIPRILYSLKNRYKDKYNLIVNTIMNIFPFIINIHVKEISLDNVKNNFDDDVPIEMTDKIYTLYAEHRNMKGKVSFEAMSDGVKRVLLLYTYIVLAQLNNVLLIGIEEPENSINPGLLRKFLIGLDNFIEDGRIIITSHSPFLINYVNPYHLYIGLPNQDSNATFRKFRQNALPKLINQAKENQMMVGEYIFDLMSGSSDDCKELCRYLADE